MVANPDDITLGAVVRLQNPFFSEDSLHRMSWVRVVKKQYPHLRMTICCHRRAREGDIIVSFPAIVNGSLRGTSLVHKECLMRFAEEVPDEQTVIRARWLSIRKKHRVKSNS